MALSWNEIKSRAAAFSLEWAGEASENAEAKSFWDGFFGIFGIPRRRIATFEHAVQKANAHTGFIDLLWKGTIMVEHKSRGRNLDRAFEQAKDYFPGLTDAELPRYILVSDFEQFRLYDLEEDTRHDFTLGQLVQHVELFGFMAGYHKRSFREQDPVNIKAAEMMGRLHDQLKATGYEGHQLEHYLVRLLFCLFADDTTIFEQGVFYEFLDVRTAPDGSDLARSLAEIFEVLNTPPERRLKNLDAQLAAFPYVNGKLFEEHLMMAAFDREMRQTLLDCSKLDWGTISPAIFGSLFQSVMDTGARRNLGAHYTSEANILKVIKPLFLDVLWTEFAGIKAHPRKLREFHKKLSQLRFLDPACGCGNFLIMAYRELRLLEIEVVRILLRGQTVTAINDYLLVEVDHFYGIEYDEFPAQIAQVAMWLIDHQMNMRAGEAFGQYYVRLPLKKSATIVQGNALRTDWQSLLTRDLKDLWAGEKSESGLHFDYILGNPPFVGKQYQNAAQKEDMAAVFAGIKGGGSLDYVAAWYKLSANYSDIFEKVRCAFVSTNSISQGEQAGILWSDLFGAHNIKIQFAHRTFSWRNEARGNAAVHVVIIGFGKEDVSNKRLYVYDDINASSHEERVSNINAYLIEAGNNFISARRKPICPVPEMAFGSMPNDGGFLIFTESEKEQFLKEEPKAEKFLRKFIGSHEYLNGYTRWCLWLVDAQPHELRELPHIGAKIKEVQKTRLASNRPTTNKLAAFASLFGENRQPITDYLIFPEVSSERRIYVPVSFMDKDVITSNKNYTISDATLYHLGVLQSSMHISWFRHVGGRMKSDLSYSAGIVYNNYPWPENPSAGKKAAVEAAAQGVLNARAQFPQSSLADLYDPLTMPPALVKAHSQGKRIRKSG